MCAAAFLFSPAKLLQMDQLSAWIQCAVHSHAFSDKFLDFILMIEIVSLPCGLFLQHVFVALLHNRAAKTLNSSGLRCRSL